MPLSASTLPAICASCSHRGGQDPDAAPSANHSGKDHCFVIGTVAGMKCFDPENTANFEAFHQISPPVCQAITMGANCVERLFDAAYPN